jgi:hypothetical protein
MRAGEFLSLCSYGGGKESLVKNENTVCVTVEIDMHKR